MILLLLLLPSFLLLLFKLLLLLILLLLLFLVLLLILPLLLLTLLLQLQLRFVREVLEQHPLREHLPPAVYMQRLLKCLYTAAELLQLPLTDAFCDSVFA